uniref:Outer dense fiber protein 3 n=1 Tax=Anopheles atroparvus TaxID=41427 RepID=A0AAG5CUA0_ANOAO
MQGPGPAKYKLPSTFGFNEHDPRKERKPMYTMRALPKYNRGGTIGPGPAGYALEKLTRTGKPHDRMYSMGARLQMPKQDLTPGPGAHDNHRVPTMKCNRAPMYSFGKRLDLSNKDIVPGPNRYDGVVHMCRPKAPAYSMRQRTKELEGYVGPGPAKYGLPTCDVTRTRPPNYSMRAAYKPLVERTPHPGPNHYGLMNLQVARTAPSYTFGIRYPQWKLPMVVPGDNC